MRKASISIVESNSVSGVYLINHDIAQTQLGTIIGTYCVHNRASMQLHVLTKQAFLSSWYLLRLCNA